MKGQSSALCETGAVFILFLKCTASFAALLAEFFSSIHERCWVVFFFPDV